jgi:hypothetical protein
MFSPLVHDPPLDTHWFEAAAAWQFAPDHDITASKSGGTSVDVDPRDAIDVVDLTELVTAKRFHL